MPISHLADISGIARSHIWKLMAARANPTVELIQRLADALQVDPRSLMQGEPDPPRRLRSKRVRSARSG